MLGWAEVPAPVCSELGRTEAPAPTHFEGFICEWAQNVGVGVGGSVSAGALEVVGKQVQDTQRFGTGVNQTFVFEGIVDE